MAKPRGDVPTDSGPLIAHVIDSLDGSGGSERQLVANLTYFADRRIRHHVVAIEPGGNNRIAELPDIVPVTVLFEDAVPSRMRVAQRLYTFLKAERPDLIHCVLPNASYPSRIIGPLLRIPVVESLVNISHEPIRAVDNPNVEPWKLAVYRWVDRITMRGMAGYHSVGPTVAESWHRTVGLSLDKMVVIPRGIPSVGPRMPARDRTPIANLGLAPDAFVLLSVGRQEPQKGHRYLLEAMPTIIDAVPSAELLLVGREGWSTPSLNSTIESLSLTERVHLLGSRSDVAALLCAADVFVFPSLFEGNGGNAMIEAMAAGCPVVVSNAPPMTEIADSARVATLVPRQDPAAIATAVIELYHDPARREQLAERAFAQIRAHPGPDVRAAETEAWYADLLGLPLLQG